MHLTGRPNSGAPHFCVGDMRFPAYEPTHGTYRIHVSKSKQIEEIERLEDGSAYPKSPAQAAIEFAGDSAEIPIDQLMLGID